MELQQAPTEEVSNTICETIQVKLGISFQLPEGLYKI